MQQRSSLPAASVALHGSAVEAAAGGCLSGLSDAVGLCCLATNHS